ncbi:hypothetical protein [Parapedobacter sp. 2B3]|uniref:hypothetical protein n=1 Tax=Parapedobacter sp. 2B3 TaxID=3342381 RepID=UPI0035B6013B
METTLHHRWRSLEKPAISLKNPYGTRWLWPLWRQLQMAVASFGLLALFLHCDPLLRWFDPTAAVVDAGALSLVLLAVVALGTFLTVSRWLLGLLWPVMRNYQRNHFSNNFKSLHPWQKITFYLVIFFGLLYAFVCCLASVF